MAKQARLLEQRLKLQQGEDEEEGGEGEGEEPHAAALWGANKRAYYGADGEEVGDWVTEWQGGRVAGWLS